MIRFFDTSVVIAAMIREQPCHQACLSLIQSSESGKACVYAHAMAECFSFLTGGRLPIQLDGDTAAAMIEQNISTKLRVLTLSPDDILTTLKQSRAIGVRGGGIYDALHLAAARSVQADEIFTLNLRHFQAFAPDLIDRIKAP